MLRTEKGRVASKKSVQLSEGGEEIEDLLAWV